MKRYPTLLFIGIFLLFCMQPGKSPALDEDGCLTCHRFPGLVINEEIGQLKILHIDEEIYYKSTHGEYRCKECHNTISKVPHTGESAVDCTTRCHKGEDSMPLPENYSQEGFHGKEQFYLADIEDESSCMVCHELYPHYSNNYVNAFLNMHNVYMTCEVCHTRPDKFKNLTYEWVDTENATFQGDPFGTYYNPKTRKTHKKKNFISRIEVFSTAQGKKSNLMNTTDIDRAKEFFPKKEDLSKNERENELNYFHRDIMKKEIGVACNECHVNDGIMDFEKLGFSKREIQYLTNLNIKGLVTKYEIFYFPQLFGD